MSTIIAIITFSALQFLFVHPVVSIYYFIFRVGPGFQKVIPSVYAPFSTFSGLYICQKFLSPCSCSSPLVSVIACYLVLAMCKVRETLCCPCPASAFGMLFIPGYTMWDFLSISVPPPHGSHTQSICSWFGARFSHSSRGQ